MQSGLFNTIVLGYDGSEHSEKAVDLARALAKAHNSRIVIVHAFPHVSRIVTPSQDDAHEIHDAHELAGKLAQRLKAEGLRAEPDVLEGPAAEAILNAAEAHKADLIIVGSRGLGQFKGLVIGSQSNRVVHYAKVPVLVAR
ncbi:MAG: universal stress protein [Actinobacteria bacterium]|nr:universal stress protein [Actinomycetota bacterium]